MGTFIKEAEELIGRRAAAEAPREVREAALGEFRGLLAAAAGSIDEANEAGKTALHFAARAGDLDIARALLDAGAAADPADAEGSSPLHLAARSGGPELCRLLLGRGADPNRKDSSGTAPAFYAAYRDQLGSLDALLEGGADKGATADFGGSLLHYAALGSAGPTLRRLAALGLDLEARSANGETPFQWAMYQNNGRAIDVLLELGARLNGVFDIWGNTVLTAAILADHPENVRRLLERGADVNEPNPEGRRPLHMAVSPANHRVDPEIVRILLDHGADPRAVKEDGASVLAWAADAGVAAIVRMLLEAGAGPDEDLERGGRGRKPALQAALAAGNDEIISLLLDAASILDARDEAGRTPLYLAAERGKTAAVERLLAAGVALETADEAFGQGPLHRAAARGYPDIAGALLAAGADPAARDRAGMRPADLALRYGHRRLHEHLRAAEATAGTKAEAWAIAAARAAAKIAAERPRSGAARQVPAPDARTALAEELAEGEAIVWYLGHAGWAVKTRRNLLLFDYAERGSGRPAEASLACGRLNPDELAGLAITVFASQIYPDHFDPAVFRLAEAGGEVRYVYGFDPNRKGASYAGPAFLNLGLGTTGRVGEVEVSTILSNAGGSGFLARVDGVSVFHPGDHSNRRKDLSGTFTCEIDALARRGQDLDIAFLPVQGQGMAAPELVRLGNRYVIESLRPALVFPMHSGGEEEAYLSYIGEAAPLHPEVSFHAARDPGDSWRLSPGG